jgi:acyl-CoA thioesterase-1
VDEKAAKPSYEGTIIAMGDSLTAGRGVVPESAYPAQLQKKIRKAGYNWRVINAGISGETSSGALARIKWILAQHPDIVILATGANDALRGVPISLIKENIGKAVELLQNGGVKVVLAGMRITPNLGPSYTRNFAAIYPAIARERQTILVPFFLSEVAGEPSLNLEDGIHPNPEGYKIIAETVYPYALQAIVTVR